MTEEELLEKFRTLFPETPQFADIEQHLFKMFKHFSLELEKQNEEIGRLEDLVKYSENA